MRQINNTTFISDNLGDLKPVVTIGGKSVDKFIPNLNMSFHNDEFFINLNRRDKQAINTTDKAEIDGIDKDIFYIDENGRFKWDIEFKKRPSKNSWTWELKHAEGIEFYYQRELTPEEIADGCERPIEAIGSYAVYCNKANNKYKTGKLCHIYRPFCYDINGKSIYADLLIADGQLTITIDAAWLDSAAYPVRLDPTIGYTTAGASYSTTGRYVYSARLNITIPTAGTASKIYAYLVGSGSNSNSYLGYYDNDSDYPGNLIDGNITVIVNSSTPAWYSVNTSGTLNNGSKYYPSILTNGSGTNNGIYYDTGSSGDNCRTAATTSMPSVYGIHADSSYKRSIYLEYTESGGATGGSLVGASTLVGGVLCGKGNLIN